MKLLPNISKYFKSFGVSSDIFVKSLKGFLAFFRNKNEINRQIEEFDKAFKIKNIYPCLSDRFEHTSLIPLHYFYQDLFVARKIFEDKPSKHVDGSSRVDGFIAHVATFREIEILYTRNLIEHFGLGRYGDQIDINSYLKGLEKPYSILNKRGKFYFSTPIGSQRIEFNTHRVFH